MPDAAAQGHGLFHGKPPDDPRLVVAHHGVAKAQEDVRCGHPLLLPMDDVRFGEDRAAAGEPWDGAGLPHQAGVVLQFQSQPGHLILKEGAGTSGAVFIYRKPGRGVLIQAGEEAGALAADFNGGAGFRGQQPDAEGDGWDLPQHGQGIAPLFQPVARVSGDDHRAAAGPRVRG